MNWDTLHALWVYPLYWLWSLLGWAQDTVMVRGGEAVLIRRCDKPMFLARGYSELRCHRWPHCGCEGRTCGEEAAE